MSAIKIGQGFKSPLRQTLGEPCANLAQCSFLATQICWWKGVHTTFYSIVCMYTYIILYIYTVYIYILKGCRPCPRPLKTIRRGNMWRQKLLWRCRPGTAAAAAPAAGAAAGAATAVAVAAAAVAVAAPPSATSGPLKKLDGLNWHVFVPAVTDWPPSATPDTMLLKDWTTSKNMLPRGLTSFLDSTNNNASSAAGPAVPTAGLLFLLLYLTRLRNTRTPCHWRTERPPKTCCPEAWPPFWMLLKTRRVEFSC